MVEYITPIVEGLPREIALRQKQYDYYRDLLLNFPKQDFVSSCLRVNQKEAGA